MKPQKLTNKLSFGLTSQFSHLTVTSIASLLVCCGGIIFKGIAKLMPAPSASNILSRSKSGAPTGFVQRSGSFAKVQP